uniref:Carboxypeptidase inhibitor n=1 Tax=Haemaphysalis longicornis TaxID=44386 RepID=A8C364_HAELO|nr:carboxypeptidase inhibitor [Haemaphysalis longicornis]
MKSTVALIIVFSLLVLVCGDVNDCVSHGFGCTPESRCPPELRLSYTGCDTVCCDISRLTGCENKGGECQPREKPCRELPSENVSCSEEQKCCVLLE